MTVEYDYLVIGSGAGGGAAAWRLASSGHHVTVVEAGPAFDPAQDYRLSQDDWEQPFPQKPGSVGPYDIAPLQLLTDATGDIRSWNAINGPYVKQAHRQSFGYHHVRGVGGSSLHFTGEAHRMNPRSMRLATDFGRGADWPMDYAALAPYWDIAESVVGVAGPIEDRRCQRNGPYPQPAHPISYASLVLARGLEQMGASWQANSLAVLSVPTKDRPNCNHCGGCLRGCPLTDKGSVDVTYLRQAVATGRCDVLPGVEALQIQTDGTKVTGVLIASKRGQEVLKARVVIVACGAIQTPRLLLNSADRHSPEGLCNEAGLVGQNFMETLLTTSSALHPDRLGSHRGLPVDWVCWDWNAPDAIPGVIGGCRFSPAMAESDLVGPVAYATRVVPGWGKDHKKAMRDSFGRVLSIAGIGESLPHPQSFVSLSARKDGHGLPVAQIQSHLDDMAIDRLRFMTETCRAILAATGCGPVFEEFSSVDAFSSTHVFGTCRLGTSPGTSVTDPFGRSHRWRNLLIADASLFPSSGGGESPGLTIQALAIRGVDNLLETP